MSRGSTNLISLATDISGFDEEPEIMSNEFYKIAVREGEKFQERSSCKELRWFKLKAALDKCNSYFAKRYVKQVKVKVLSFSICLLAI